MVCPNCGAEMVDAGTTLFEGDLVHVYGCGQCLGVFLVPTDMHRDRTCTVHPT